MVKNDISFISVNQKDKIIKVQLKCCFMQVISYAPETLTDEQRPYFECEDFWLMLKKLCKKHKLQEHAPTPSIESDYSLFDVLDHFFEVTYS